ncbi:MAG: PaaI family thioesterase [Sphingosinicella sp.]|uniref:PaaI family thioesterase n=1 Tax=Sphingosinicella sp. TaxID=1917971 RepID=UPI004037B156
MSDPRSPETSFDPEKFMSYVRRVGHGGALGIAYVAHGEDWAELSLPYRPELVGMPESGIIASGPIISLMDMATSLAIWVRLGHFRHQATLDLRVDYLRPAVPERTITGRGECYGLTRSVGFVRGLAHDGDPDDPVAHVSGTFIVTE